ncbi:hypothetical protein TrCOL_g13225 [Triparma columacea]|uniref:Uncharacterized protein n=1 Tax=Triparma columacea TaxID=722753 RepID=A0A9W7G5H9_9STRA|nr:hypothetical protein TrCOL_g13225 [Triparma columacea]
MATCLDEGLGAELVEEVGKNLDLGGEGEEGGEGRKVNVVVGQIAFISWCLYEKGVEGGGLKRGIMDALQKHVGDEENVYAGVEGLICTSLELGSRMRDRSASGVFGSRGGAVGVGGGGEGVVYGGGKFGSSGGGGGGVDEKGGGEGGEDVDKAVEGFKEALEKKKRSSFGGMGEMGF